MQYHSGKHEVSVFYNLAIDLPWPHNLIMIISGQAIYLVVHPVVFGYIFYYFYMYSISIDIGR